MFCHVGGFSNDDYKAALAASNNNIEIATDILLTKSSIPDPVPAVRSVTAPASLGEFASDQFISFFTFILVFAGMECIDLQMFVHI